MDGPNEPVAHWRIICAFLLDALFAFLVFGYAVAVVTGGLTHDGFRLEGFPALVLAGLVIAYFVVGRRRGGTVFQRLLGVRRQRSGA